MIKKFVPLDDEVDPSQTPFDIKTYNAPEYEDIPRPINIDPCCYTSSSQPCKQDISEVRTNLTLEQAILRKLGAPQEPRPQKSCKKKCQTKFDPFSTCVMLQRTPKILKHHARMREKFIKIKEEQAQRVHDAQEPSGSESPIQMESPIFISNVRVKPKLASPACSVETFYVPSRKLLNLKRPRSGIFINETPRPIDSGVPFESFDPRKLQEKLERDQRTRYTLYSDGDKYYIPCWQGQGDTYNPPKLDRALPPDCAITPFDFTIPNDTYKTFRSEIMFGNEVLPPQDEDVGPNRPVEIACLYVAFVESFCKNPFFWTPNDVDSVIQNGITLRNRSVEFRYENPKDFAIIPEITEKEATVQMKLHLVGVLNNEPNILKALTIFFSKYQSAILYSKDLYLLIMKRDAKSFFIFDPSGRDVQCRRDVIHGKPSLIGLQMVEHIVHLILNNSGLDARNDEFSLYEICLKEFGKLSEPMQFARHSPNKKLCALVNQFYKIIPGLSGLPQIIGGKSVVDNPSMTISFLSILYNQIEPSKLWTMQQVDDLIKFGKKYHEDYISDNRLKKLNIADLPEGVFFGNYRVLVEKKTFVSSGHVTACRSYRISQLTLALRDFFKDHKSGLLQVDACTFGLWTKRNTFFVFDPFKRGPAGQATTLKTGVGCLQIHLNIDSLCRIIFMLAGTIKTEGIFFLHAVRVKAIGTFNINRVMENAAGFGTLHIKFPFTCDTAPRDGDEGQENEMLSNVDTINYSIVNCLSELSVGPCERTCSEREFLLQQKKLSAKKRLIQKSSIHSIPEQYKIAAFDDVDVIDSVLDEYVCDLMTTIEKRTTKKRKVCVEASKVLLQSDKGHLKLLQMHLKRGEDFDNVCETFKRIPPPYSQLSVEEELAIESNFIVLPDGNWVIFGLKDVDCEEEPLRGILATLTAAAVSAKYNVATWSSDVMEYVRESSVLLEERFRSYSNTLSLIFSKKLPNIQLGSATFYLKIIANESVEPYKLKESLENALLRVTKFFLICKGLTCLIVRRYNFIYMFMGSPCDAVGFRSISPGPMCLLRFLDLNGLVRRIDNACGSCQKYVLVLLDVKDVTAARVNKFLMRTESQEELLYDQELAKKKEEEKKYQAKMMFIESELMKESKRLQDFQKQKRKEQSALERTPSQHSEEEGEYEESEQSVEFKHKPGKSLQNVREKEEADLRPGEMEHKLGYQLRAKDCLFKIQASKAALDDRFSAALDQIKPCFFASSIAVLFAISRPLYHWNGRRIDKVLYIANNIANQSTNLDTANERIIKNIEVDEFIFEIQVQVFTPLGTFGGNLEYKIMKTIQTQKYFLIQISNTTFAVYYDQFFHLFDPYRSMDTREPDDGTKDEPQCPDFTEATPEQNTASWILFGDLGTMVTYIQDRAANEEWKSEYKLHIITIVSHKTDTKKTQLLSLLTSDLDTCQKTSREVNLCAHPEEIEWLDIYPNLVIWSRLNRSNSVKQLRGSPLTKEKNFDIEIPGKLYSLWGSIHPMSSVFHKYRGKQQLAIGVVACCLASVYNVSEWNSQVLDSIVIKGNEYFEGSVFSITREDYEISLEHLNATFEMGHLSFQIHLESIVYGCLYTTSRGELNLAAALTYFFTSNSYGIIQCMRRSAAIGKLDGGFFMLECQSHGLPLFPAGQGAAYVLRTTQLQTLLYCLIMTFNLPYYNTQFTIHKVEVLNSRVEPQEDANEQGIEVGDE